MIKETYKNYLIESDGLKSAPDRVYAQKISFRIKNYDKPVSFDFLISQMDFDTGPLKEEDFILLCLEKIKEVLDREDDLTNHLFEHRGSIFVEV